MPAGLIETMVVWESKGLSNIKTKLPTTSNESLFPKLKWHNSNMRVELKGSYLKQSNFYSKKCSEFIHGL